MDHEGLEPPTPRFEDLDYTFCFILYNGVSIDK
jgi:hypothetical protein